MSMGLNLVQLFIFLTLHNLCAAQGFPSQQQQPNSDSNSKPFCKFRNKEYSPGDSWYPTSTQSFGAYCVICTCLSSGRQNCTKQECPTDCLLDQPASLQHPCCKVCEENSDSSQSGQASHGSPNLGIISSDTESGEEDDEDGDLVTENSEFVSCLHQGKIYKDGESFTANVSGLPISVHDQCMLCLCQSGMVLCQMKSCSSIKCNANGESPMSSIISAATSFSSSSDTCCQKCSAWRATSKNERSENRNEPTNTNQRATSRDRFNDDNARPGAGQVTSISESTISFREHPNGSGINGNTTTPQRERGRQNEDCISAGRFYMHGTTWHPVIGPFGTMECVVCKCNRGQIDCGRLKCQPKKDMPCAKPVKVEGHCCPICTSSINNDTPTEGSRMCVSGKQDVTSYRAQGYGMNATEFIKFGFVKLRKNADPQVDLHEWALKDGEILQFQTNYMTTDEFNDIKARQTFTIVGATNDKNLDKFTRREKKLEKRCLVRCSIRILSLERSLRLHKLVSRKACLLSERTRLMKGIVWRGWQLSHLKCDDDCYLTTTWFVGSTEPNIATGLPTSRVST